MEDASARKFEILLAWKLDRFGRSLVDCLNNIQSSGSSLSPKGSIPTSRIPPRDFCSTSRGAAAEFERSLIRERTLAGQQRYRHDYAAGKVGKTVYSRSGKNLPPHRPRKIFNRDSVAILRSEGLSIRAIAIRLGVGVGTVSRTLQARSKSS
jgi:DNA invertase Pin-like site-specific DNA recombinase